MHKIPTHSHDLLWSCLIQSYFNPKQIKIQFPLNPWVLFTLFHLKKGYSFLLTWAFFFFQFLFHSQTLKSFIWALFCFSKYQDWACTFMFGFHMLPNTLYSDYFALFFHLFKSFKGIKTVAAKVTWANTGQIAVTANWIGMTDVDNAEVSRVVETIIKCSTKRRLAITLD